MLMEQSLIKIKVENNVLNKIFFGALAFIFTIPIILGLLIIILTYMTNSSNLIVAIVGVIFVSFWCIYLGEATLRVATNKLIITNKKLVITYYSYFKKSQIEIFFDKIDEISISQNIFSKILNCGEISIKTVGGSTNSIAGIHMPYNVKAQIQECISP